MNIFNKGKVKNQVNISGIGNMISNAINIDDNNITINGNGIITGNNINIKNSSIISTNCSNVQMVSTNTENYVIVNGKRYDAPVGASINVINNKVYVNNKKIN